MERQVGEVFDYDGVTLEVIEHGACLACYFYKERIYCGDLKRDILGSCGNINRSDRKMVVFKKVEKSAL